MTLFIQSSKIQYYLLNSSSMQRLLITLKIFLLPKKHLRSTLTQQETHVKRSSHDHILIDKGQIHLHLKFKFRGVYATDNYPLKLQFNTFINVNASRSNSLGIQWLVLSKGYGYPII